MKIYLKNIDVVEEVADVLIYSTNVLLNCSGGVGSCLMTKYGNVVQEDMHQLLNAEGRKFAVQGEIFEKVSEGMPYMMVFHTVPNDPMYNTSAEIVEDVLRRCLASAIEHRGVKTLAISALATGYGRLFFDDFFRIAERVLRDSDYNFFEKATLCVYDEYSYSLAKEQIKNEGLAVLAI